MRSSLVILCSALFLAFFSVQTARSQTMEIRLDECELNRQKELNQLYREDKGLKELLKSQNVKLELKKWAHVNAPDVIATLEMISTEMKGTKTCPSTAASLNFGMNEKWYQQLNALVSKGVELGVPAQTRIQSRLKDQSKGAWGCHARFPKTPGTDVISDDLFGRPWIPTEWKFSSRALLETFRWDVVPASVRYRFWGLDSSQVVRLQEVASGIYEANDIVHTADNDSDYLIHSYRKGPDSFAGVYTDRVFIEPVPGIVVVGNHLDPKLASAYPFQYLSTPFEFLSLPEQDSREEAEIQARKNRIQAKVPKCGR